MFCLGLGCNPEHSSQCSSVRLWKTFFGEYLDFWLAELDEQCVKNMTAIGRLDGVHTLVGDQSNATLLQRWITVSGGNFDIIIDDAAHGNLHIFNSFNALWPTVRPGGLYFLEDLHVGRSVHNLRERSVPVVSDLLSCWTDQLLMSQAPGGILSHSAELMRMRYPVPSDVKWILCQQSACVIGKCDKDEYKCGTKTDRRGMI